MRKFYLRPTATGNGDGRSWDNAFTTAAAAVAALASGDVLYTDGVIVGGIPQISNLDDLTIIGDEGPSGGTRLFGMTTVAEGSLQDHGGGIYSFASISTIPTLTWNYRQDDVNGTVTGVTSMRRDILDLYQGLAVPLPVPRAWYGHFARNATFGTTTPVEGCWSHTGGRSYFHVPGTPSLAEVSATLGVGTLNRGMYLFNCDRPTIRGMTAVGFGAALPQNGSFYFSGCSNVTLVDCVSYDAGYRAFNLDGDTGSTAPTDHLLDRCYAYGDTVCGLTTNNNPFVFYNQTGTTRAGVIKKSGIVGYPWLGLSGRPILGGGANTLMTQEYKPSGFYSHAGAGNKMGGIVLEDFSMLSMCQPLNEKHHPNATLAMFWPLERIGIMLNTDAPVYDPTDPDAYPVQVKGGVIYGNIRQHGNVALRGVRAFMPTAKGGLPNYFGSTTGVNENISFSEASAPLYYEGCEMVFRQTNNARGIWFAPSRDCKIYMDLCTVVYDCPSPNADGDPFIYHTGGGAGQDGTTLRLRGCVFKHMGPGTTGRQFLKRNGALNVSADYGREIFGRWTIEACVWDNFDTSTDFNRGGGSGSFKGEEYEEFADNAGGSPLNAAGMFVFNTDPELEDIDAGVLTPRAEGWLSSARITASIAGLNEALGINGAKYSGRYGSFQGGSPDTTNFRHLGSSNLGRLFPTSPFWDGYNRPQV